MTEPVTITFAGDLYKRLEAFRQVISANEGWEQNHRNAVFDALEIALGRRTCHAAADDPISDGELDAMERNIVASENPDGTQLRLVRMARERNRFVRELETLQRDMRDELTQTFKRLRKMKKIGATP